MTARRYEKIRRVLERRQPDLSILAENVYKPHNLSAMLRSCDAVGIGVVHAVNPTGGVPTYNETSASADKWVRLEVHDSLEHAHRQLRAEDMRLYAAHISEHTVDYREVDYTGGCCILFGNEKEGVSAEAAAFADEHVLIPMYGMVQSLNVSVAAAVILFEAQRQRRVAGFYDRPRLSDEAMHKQAFAWLHPKRALELEQRGLPFPALAPDGSIMS